MIEIIGFILDLIIGEPNNPLHPVRIIGNFAAFIEKINRKIFKNYLKFAGGVTWVIVVLVSFIIPFFFLKWIYGINEFLFIGISSILIYFCISTKGLKTEGFKVIKYIINDDIEAARKQLSFIVGRDTESLDKRGILKAVVETIGENMSDGIIAPLIFIGLGGAPLGVAYKAVNTMDSMFGYKNDKYKDFGFVAAKLDDLFNLIPARITGILIIIASYILGLDGKNSYKIYKRDRKNHSSPNSAHPEAAVAGALGLMLGGTNYYFGKPVVKPTIGDNINEIEIHHVYDVSKILYVTATLGLVVALLLNLLVGGILK